jgi:transcriptional regulator with XRE-family HTH domain
MSFDLKSERLNKGLSVRQLAAEIKVSAAAVARAEAGESIHPANAKRIADFYGKSVTDIWPVEKATA